MSATFRPLRPHGQPQIGTLSHLESAHRLAEPERKAGGRPGDPGQGGRGHSQPHHTQLGLGLPALPSSGRWPLGFQISSLQRASANLSSQGQPKGLAEEPLRQSSAPSSLDAASHAPSPHLHGLHGRGMWHAVSGAPATFNDPPDCWGGLESWAWSCCKAASDGQKTRS